MLKKTGVRQQNDPPKGRLKTAAGVLAILICVGFSTFFGWKLTHPHEEAYERQRAEEALADRYILELLRQTDTEKGTGPDTDSPPVTGNDHSSPDERIAAENSASAPDGQAASAPGGPGGADTDAPAPASFSDDAYYSDGVTTYTPDYARGRIDCVLEIDKPDVRIRRGVYTGSWEEIEHDLAVWMVTAARPDYELGRTHYVILGHNTEAQELSFNRLKNVVSGDFFTLYGISAVYVYEVVKTAFLSREAAAAVADDFTLPADRCFIFTCASGAHNGQDLMVEGRLYRRYAPDEWAAYH